MKRKGDSPSSTTNIAQGSNSEIPPKEFSGRRSFLFRSSFAVTSALLVPPALNAVGMPAASQPQVRKYNSLSLYGGESGNLTNSGYFVIGFLMARNSNKHLEYIRQLRQKHRFRRRLRYSSTDRFNQPFVADFIDFFFKEKDLTFEASVVDYHLAGRIHSSGLTEAYKDRAARDAYYLQAYGTIVTDNAAKGESLMINLINHGVTQDLALHQHLRALSGCESVNLVLASKSDLIQMAGYLAGSVLGDAERGRSKISEHDFRAKLTSRLKQHLGTASLIDRALAKNTKFKVNVLNTRRKLRST